MKPDVRINPERDLERGNGPTERPARRVRGSDDRGDDLRREENGPMSRLLDVILDVLVIGFGVVSVLIWMRR